MEPGAEYTMSHGPAASVVPSAMPASHSPWQSPVPYLFGGLAAMLGLIALALLVLACTYWKLSGYLGSSDQDGSGGQADDESGGEKGTVAGAFRPAAELREHVVVIMAGDERPSFLAMPVSNRAVTELGVDAAVSCSGGSEEGKKVDKCEKQTSSSATHH